ncbi:unnamed protein product [Protopolystoma xenopodis]|uniref:Uncharacterized protein n=1 Tax=Protopolystoma xenopodis TaxID=117903 RepID=A0A3S5B1I8_9PLAT|nr:unnamed protein product [Protopolystoma xenopodis]
MLEPAESSAGSDPLLFRCEDVVSNTGFIVGASTFYTGGLDTSAVTGSYSSCIRTNPASLSYDDSSTLHVTNSGLDRNEVQTRSPSVFSVAVPHPLNLDPSTPTISPMCLESVGSCTSSVKVSPEPSGTWSGSSQMRLGSAAPICTGRQLISKMHVSPELEPSTRTPNWPTGSGAVGRLRDSILTCESGSGCLAEWTGSEGIEDSQVWLSRGVDVKRDRIETEEKEKGKWKGGGRTVRARIGFGGKHRSISTFLPASQPYLAANFFLFFTTLSPVLSPLSFRPLSSVAHVNILASPASPITPVQTRAHVLLPLLAASKVSSGSRPRLHPASALGALLRPEQLLFSGPPPPAHEQFPGLLLSPQIPVNPIPSGLALNSSPFNNGSYPSVPQRCVLPSELATTSSFPSLETVVDQQPIYSVSLRSRSGTALAHQSHRHHIGSSLLSVGTADVPFGPEPIGHVIESALWSAFQLAGLLGLLLTGQVKDSDMSISEVAEIDTILIPVEEELRDTRTAEQHQMKDMTTDQDRVGIRADITTFSPRLPSPLTWSSPCSLPSKPVSVSNSSCASSFYKPVHYADSGKKTPVLATSSHSYDTGGGGKSGQLKEMCTGATPVESGLLCTSPVGAPVIASFGESWIMALDSCKLDQDQDVADHCLPSFGTFTGSSRRQNYSHHLKRYQHQHHDQNNLKLDYNTNLSRAELNSSLRLCPTAGTGTHEFSSTPSNALSKDLSSLSTSPSPSTTGAYFFASFGRAFAGRNRPSVVHFFRGHQHQQQQQLQLSKSQIKSLPDRALFSKRNTMAIDSTKSIANTYSPCSIEQMRIP